MIKNCKPSKRKIMYKKIFTQKLYNYMSSVELKNLIHDTMVLAMVTIFLKNVSLDEVNI